MRPLNPRLLAAIQQTAIEPIDYEQPGRVVEVPVPPEHFQAPPPAQPAPAAKKPSRLELIRGILDAQPVSTQPDFGVEPDVRAAGMADARRDFGNAMLAAGQSFLGNRAAVGRLSSSNSSEQSAVAQSAARRRAIADWLDSQNKQQIDRARVLASASAEPAQKNEALEGRRLDLQEQELERRRKADENRLELDREKFEAGKNKGAKSSGAGSQGKMLPASTVEGLAELPVAEAQVDLLAKEFERLGMGGWKGRIGGAVTDVLGLRFTDSAEYNAAAKRTMQAAGKILEGGKLAAGDEVKYVQLLPRPGDSSEIVAQKVTGMKDFLRSLAAARAKGLKESGYIVPASLVPRDAAPAPSTPKDSRRIARNPETGARHYINADGSIGEVVK